MLQGGKTSAAAQTYRPVEEFTAPPPARGRDEMIDWYVDAFNRHDEELYPQDITNDMAADWMRREIPLFECADPLLERVYYFRWWTFRKHIATTPEGRIVTEFLPDVYWAGPYNSINCASAHHLAEARWLKGGRELVRDYVRFWFRGSGDEFSYSSWIVDAVWRYACIRDDRRFAVGMLDDFVRFYREVENRNMTGYGLFWSHDDRDAMEDSISGPGLRPTLNSYMAANAYAISRIARWANRVDLADEYRAKGDVLVRLMRERLWDPRSEFFKVLPLAERDDTLDAGGFSDIDASRNVREEIGYIPWMFGLTGPEHSDAWRFLNDPRHFAGAAGIRTAEACHPRYMNRDKAHECQWNGPCWPFATTQTLDAMIQSARSGIVGIGVDDFMRELRRYAAIHVRQAEDGSIVDWLDEDLDADTGVWLAREQLKAWGWREDKGGYERGKDYNHSAFCDLIISGLAGVDVEDDTEGAVLTVKPLGRGAALPYWRLLGLPVGGRTVDVYYDAVGDRYGQGRGLCVRVDGAVLRDESAEPQVRYRL